MRAAVNEIQVEIRNFAKYQANLSMAFTPLALHLLDAAYSNPIKAIRESPTEVGSRTSMTQILSTTQALPASR